MIARIILICFGTTVLLVAVRRMRLTDSRNAT